MPEPSTPGPKPPSTPGVPPEPGAPRDYLAPSRAAAPAAGAAKPPSPPPRIDPPEFREILEGTVSALIMPKQTFGTLGLLPPPDASILLINAVLWAGAGVAVQAALGSFASLSPTRMVMTTALAVPACLAAACAVYVLALISGGTGSFNRALQTVSLLGALVPLDAALALAPQARLILYLYGAYLAVRAATYMHRAPVVQASMVFGLAGGVASVGLWLFTKDASGWRSLPVGPGIAEASRGLHERVGGASQASVGLPIPEIPQEALGPGSLSLVGAAPPGSGAPAPMSLGQLQEIMRMAGRLQPPGAGPEGAPPLELLKPGQAPNPEQMRQMQQWGYGMLKNMQNAYSSPDFQKRLNPAQARQFQQLMQVSDDLLRKYEDRSKTGEAAELSDAEAQRMMQQLGAVMGSSLKEVSAPSSSKRRKRPVLTK